MADEREGSDTQVRSARVAEWIRGLTASWTVRGVPRLLYATRHLTLGKGPGLFQLNRDLRLLLNPDDYFQCMMFYRRYSPEILEILEHLVAPGDAVVDVGAHIGYFSIHLARIVTSAGCVYSFEPDPRARQCLVRSVEANQMRQVYTFPTALAAGRGMIDFFLSPQLGWSTGVRNSHLADLRTIEVESTSLDFLVESGVVSSSIRLVKIDVEGFEGEVIRGMRRVLETTRPILMLEINNLMLGAQGESPSSTLKPLTSLDYEVYAIRRGRSFTYKGRASPPGTLNGARLSSRVARLTLNNEQVPDGDVVCIPCEHGSALLESSSAEGSSAR